MNETLRIPDHFLPAFAKLDEEFDLQKLPAKLLDRNLLIATWNIRNLISYHKDKDWLAKPRNPPEQKEEFNKPQIISRDPFALNFITRIIAHFDLVILTKVRYGAEAVRGIHEILGPNWGILI